MSTWEVVALIGGCFIGGVIVGAILRAMVSARERKDDHEN